MKKFACFLLVLLLMLSSASVFAKNAEADEGFSVRGKISFDTTKEEIMAYEESEGSTLLINPTEFEYYSENCVVCKNISFAGYDNASVIYYFNDNDNLVSILFVVSHGAEQGGKNIVADIYERLNQTLESKYGVAFNADKMLYLEKDIEAYGTVEWVKLMDILAAPQLIDFGQRIAYIGDGYVEVQIMEVHYNDLEYMGNKQEDYERYAVAISYSFIDESVVEEILATAEQAEKDLDSDL